MLVAGPDEEAAPAERAADVMYAVTTYDVYRSLIEVRGWSGADAENWVADMLAQLLLAPELLPQL